MTIYLDYNATTPIDPRVTEAMLPYLFQHFGNPSSNHAFGKIPKDAILKSRSQITSLIGAAFSDEIIYVGSGSEGNNLAIQGVAFANQQKGKHIITSSIEHPAVLDTCDYLKHVHGFEISYAGVNAYGQVDPEEIEKLIRPETILITIMHSNNETGTIQPIARIGELARKYGILFHSDAAQSIGKVEVNVEELKVDLLTIVGHKFYAPKGIGALYIRRGTLLERQMRGAKQEFGYRAGTENVPYIVALGEAAMWAEHELFSRSRHFLSLRDQLHESLLSQLSGVHLNGHPTIRLPNTLNVSIDGIVGYELLDLLPEIAASTGSACHSGKMNHSDVLKAMGISDNLAISALRFSIGTLTTQNEIKKASECIIHAVLKQKI